MLSREGTQWRILKKRHLRTTSWSELRRSFGPARIVHASVLTDFRRSCRQDRRISASLMISTQTWILEQFNYFKYRNFHIPVIFQFFSYTVIHVHVYNFSVFPLAYFLRFLNLLNNCQIRFRGRSVPLFNFVQQGKLYIVHLHSTES